MPFVKGVSGNPGGRTPWDAKIKRLARLETERAINALKKWCDSDHPQASVAAANALLDRAYGKPKQVIDATVSRRFVDVIEASERRAKLESALAKRIGVAGPEKPTIQ